MGYTHNGSITNYEPDDDDNTMYLLSSANYSLAQIIELTKEKWGSDTNFEDIVIEAEKIHTRCLTYDLYDAGDYDDYIVIRKI